MHGNSTSRRTLRRGAVAAATIAVLPLVLVACGTGDSDSAMSDSASDPTPSGPAERPSGSAVEIDLVAYKPAKLSVDTGTTVAWRQRDPGSHTVTSGTVEQGAGAVTTTPDARFSSGELTTGEKFDFTFADPGTYPYFCEIHPATMRGQITVR